MIYEVVVKPRNEEPKIRRFDALDRADAKAQGEQEGEVLAVVGPPDDKPERA